MFLTQAEKIINTTAISGTDVTTIVITIGDENDNNPTFDSGNYSATISELALSGEIAISGISASDPDEVSADL